MNVDVTGSHHATCSVGDVTGSHHATCSVGDGTSRTGHGIAGISRTDRIGISIGIQTDACASRSKIIVPIPSRNNRTTIGNYPIMFRNTSRIDFARIVNRKRAGRLRQRNVYLIRKTLPRLFHIQTFRLTSSHIPQLASNSSSQWKNCPADRPKSVQNVPANGRIRTLADTDCRAAIRCAAKRACERRRNGNSPCDVGGSQPLRPQ